MCQCRGFLYHFTSHSPSIVLWDSIQAFWVEGETRAILALRQVQQPMPRFQRAPLRSNSVRSISLNAMHLHRGVASSFCAYRLSLRPGLFHITMSNYQPLTPPSLLSFSRHRSFGVKAELIDFECSSSGDAPPEKRSSQGITEAARADAEADSPYTQGIRHGKPGSPRTAARHGRVLQKKEQSIRSYFPSGEVGVGRSIPCKERRVASDPSGEGPAPLAVRPRSGGHRGPDSRESNAARAGSGTSGERGGLGDERWAWRRRDQLTLGGGRWQAGRRGRCGSVGKKAGRRMGRAIIEWTWEYFRTSWDVGQAFAVSSCSFPAHSCEGLRNAKSNTATARSRLCEPGTLLSTRASPWGTVEARAEGSYSNKGGGGNAGEGDIVARGAPATMDENMSQNGEDARVTRTRPPPPLYFQHDGHSRSIVGVFRSGASGQSAGHERGRRWRCLADIGVGHGTGNEGIGPADRDFEAGDFHPPRLGSLLVFDPYHPGSVIRRALDDKGTKRSWCRCDSDKGELCSRRRRRKHLRFNGQSEDIAFGFQLVRDFFASLPQRGEFSCLTRSPAESVLVGCPSALRRLRGRCMGFFS